MEDVEADNEIEEKKTLNATISINPQEGSFVIDADNKIVYSSEGIKLTITGDICDSENNISWIAVKALVDGSEEYFWCQKKDDIFEYDIKNLNGNNSDFEVQILSVEVFNNEYIVNTSGDYLAYTIICTYKKDQNKYNVIQNKDYDDKVIIYEPYEDTSIIDVSEDKSEPKAEITKIGGVINLSAKGIDNDIKIYKFIKTTKNNYFNTTVEDEINVIIMKTNDVEGTIMCSKKRFDSANAWDELEAAVESGDQVEGTVTDIIKGGIIATTQKGVRVFIPGSLTGVGRDEPMDALLKTKVTFKIIEVIKQRRRAVGSIKAFASNARREAQEKFWEQAEVGQVYTGVVKSLTNYGAFVDIGGVDGMIHISELSWKRIKHPSEVLSIGDTVEVFIKALENNKISLGYKKDEDNPWAILKKTYEVGDVIDAKIVGMTAFGAFANVIDGIDGLIHISQIADRHIEKPQDALTAGETVKAKITEIDYDKKRVSLSIRALIEPAEEEAPAAETEVVASTETPVEEAVPAEEAPVEE